ncbi:septum formation initiator family protein [Patescibacteria group bacterium]|nr:septum formation initiator family protein [Patescibacteria group bacterium]MBU4453304.1 septum formation initiator family protein [Patescibacteria group bacterium]MCG2687873.1 septum formation initiator family protein [Candidatus Parcubacteria bacterium]
MGNINTTIRQKWFVAICLILLLFFVFVFAREYVGNIQVQREIEQLEADKEYQEQTRLETMNLISQLSSEYYLEQEGRVKQGLAKEGETVVVIQDDISTKLEQDGDINIESGISNITRWFYYFFSRDTFDQIAKYEDS